MSRTIYPINRNWMYGREATPESNQRGFDDSGFERVTIPHTNIRLPWHSFDDRDYQFVSVYRRSFTPPADLRDKRVFVDFGGVMTAATVYLNGSRLGEHRGGYTPFMIELTEHLRWDTENVLAVDVDSTERSDIPPFGGQIDYLTFGGIYREVVLRVVPHTFIENVFAQPVNVLDAERWVDVRCFLEGLEPIEMPLTLTVELRDGERVLARQGAEIAAGTHPTDVVVQLENLGDVELWDLDTPRLYTVAARLMDGAEVTDEYTVRIGFRDARFTPDGFTLNGRRVQLRGLNRHQTYPYVGQAMPARVQRRDAEILKREIKCNIVRTSHYPQSPHFLDACDELGLLAFEEIPGWQHIGGEDWKQVACCNVEEMIRRDWNHPSIVLWGVRINESRDDHAFYVRTNEIARGLDPTRQIGGVRNFFDSELLEDVFTMNDFNPDYPRPPHHPLYLNTEFVGHMFPTKHIDNVERVQEHVHRHARVHDMLGARDDFAGGIGWCAFDYNTHADFGSGDRICYHGVSDIFRIPKPAAGFYRSQCDPAEEVVLEPAFHWAIGDKSEGGGPGAGIICSNCEELKLYIGEELRAEIRPDRERYPNLSYPPFTTDQLTGLWGQVWSDLQIDGYIGGQKVASKRMSARGVDRQFFLETDDLTLEGDGIDATRVVFRVTDEFGAARPFSTGAVTLTIEGPGEIIGDNPFALTGGVGAVWVRAAQQPGTIRLRAAHPVLGSRTAEIRVMEAPPEQV
ncbi:MAG: glycoside hydrolase family 2 protein [Chloroflexota bacterium]|nr:glycoside hydrolase family 2 protein [Chloroflexota bacterium]